MTDINERYRCEICGNVVSIVEYGAGNLVCCGHPMKLLKEKSCEEEGKEKHVPVVEIYGGGVHVKVGSVPHPMEKSHYINTIQLMKDGKVLTGRRLNHGDKPEAKFCIDDTEGITARVLCNVHGLWKSK